MEDDILDSLEDLGYNGPFIQEGAFEKAIEEGPKSIIYTQVVEWLSKELKVLCKLEDHVNAISNPDDSSSFLLEVSSFLKELCCPYISLTEGPVSQRLLSRESRLQLIDFLSSELLAARMLVHNKPESKTLQVEIAESPTASDLKTMLIALGFPKPPQNITPLQLFNKVEVKVKDLITKVPPKLIGKPFFTGVLSDKQWHLFESLFKEMFKEYQLRREMLLKRLDVTIQSFKWSDKAKVKENQIAQVFMPIRKLLVPEPNVTMADLLAAREDLAIMEKISTAAVRKNTSCAVNKVLIGKVPDRGGRPNEQQPPPPEMPSWQKRSDGGNRGDGNRGGGSGSDRGRVQGGWSGGGGRGGGGGGGGQGYQGNNNQYASRDNYSSWGGGGGTGGGYGGGVPVFAAGMQPVYVAQPQVAYAGQGGYQTGGYQSGGCQSGGYQTDNYQTGGYHTGGYQGGGNVGGGYGGGGQGRGGGYSDGGQRGKNRGRGGGRGGRGQQHYQSNDRYQQHQSGYNYSYDAGGYR